MFQMEPTMEISNQPTNQPWKMFGNLSTTMSSRITSKIPSLGGDEHLFVMRQTGLLTVPLPKGQVSGVSSQITFVRSYASWKQYQYLNISELHESWDIPPLPKTLDLGTGQITWHLFGYSQKIPPPPGFRHCWVIRFNKSMYLAELLGKGDAWEKV